MAEPALPQKPATPPRLPVQTPAISPRRSPPPLSPQPAFSAVLHPLPKPVPEDFGDLPVQPSPKKETARITILPRPSPPPASVSPASLLSATSRGIDAFDSIPRWFCWGLLGLSAFIFLTQIWNYALS